MLSAQDKSQKNRFDASHLYLYKRISRDNERIKKNCPLRSFKRFILYLSQTKKVYNARYSNRFHVTVILD